MTDTRVPLREVLATNVAAAREAERLGQQDLADLMGACGVPWSANTVAKIETARRETSAGRLIALGMVLGRSLEQLFEMQGVQGVELGKPDARLDRRSLAWIPVEAVFAWIRGRRPRPAEFIGWEELEADGAAPIWKLSPAGRKAQAAMRFMAEGGQEEADRLSRKLGRELGAWTRSEEMAGRPVTARRRRAKEASLLQAMNREGDES